MKTDNRTIGANLIIGGIVSLLWAFWCPKYRPYSDFYVTTFGAEATFDRPGRYYKMDAGVFLAGEVVIWSAVWGIFFLVRDKPSMADQRTVDSEDEAQ